MSDRALLHQVADLAADWLESLPERPVAARAGVGEMRVALGGPLPERPADPAAIIAALAATCDPGLVAMPGPRFFGFVIGGTLPAALAADWLVSAWDQNAGLAVTAAATAAEEVAAEWILDLLCLPPSASVGFVTGGQQANTTALAAARHHVLAAAGWDVEADGLAGAPRVRVVVGEERHITIDRALRLLGFGVSSIVALPADEQGRMDARALPAVLEPGVPAIVCAQAGNVNTGAVDDLEAITAAAARTGAWVHVDGAFGLWAAAAPARRHLVAGVGRADSWATDGHKWLNVPYDSGIVICAHPDSHRAAMAATASYLVQGAERVPFEYVPELSRRARALPVLAALRSLGRRGLADLVEGNCRRAASIAQRLAGEPGVEILNDVVLNQALVRFGDDDDLTTAVVSGVQQEGTCWLGGTRWHGRGALRLSVSGWSTTQEDAERSADAIAGVWRSIRSG
jgi:glutamate/tyrosine decarboxylase-like PLP-dependent enzyme